MCTHTWSPYRLEQQFYPHRVRAWDFLRDLGAHKPPTPFLALAGVATAYFSKFLPRCPVDLTRGQGWVMALAGLILSGASLPKTVIFHSRPAPASHLGLDLLSWFGGSTAGVLSLCQQQLILPPRRTEHSEEISTAFSAPACSQE